MSKASETHASRHRTATSSADDDATPGGAADRTADEPDLVAAVQRGDERAFSVLVARYMDTSYAIALSILRSEQDAEDAVQSAFIRALERIEQLRAGSRFGPWYYRVLRSTCLNLRRREMLRSHQEVPETAHGSEDPHRELERKQARERILDALARLPERQRTAVMMYDLEGYDHAEIAEILEIAVGTSRANLHHGRQALRRILGGEGDPDEA